MADSTEKLLTIDTVCWLPDGGVQLSGAIRTVTTRFTLDPELLEENHRPGGLGPARRCRERRGMSEFARALAHLLIPLRRGLSAIVATIEADRK
jgi:hypothetical protein